ncbi:MAG: sulfite exporter TauE/SafE family protein [Actinomycetota bacterium]|nr:sulfite exporter TauE/SafE family protein [Actinomycetota bacterium]
MLQLALIGLVAGLFSALFGVGGGILVVPLLVLVARYGEREAAGTSLAAIGVTALAGTVAYGLLGRVHVGDGLLVGLPAAAGAVAGTALQQRLPLRALALGFAALLVVVAGLLFFDAEPSLAAGGTAIAALLGVAAGVLAGLFGVGGGILFVPTLVALGLSHLDAEATSLLAILPTVAAGAWRQERYGNLRRVPALAIGVASLPGVAVGVALAESVPEETLQRLFALLMVGVAAQIAWRARRK